MPSSNHAAFLKLLLNPKVGFTNQSKFSSALFKKKLSGELIDSRYSVCNYLNLQGGGY